MQSLRQLYGEIRGFRWSGFKVLFNESLLCGKLLYQKDFKNKLLNRKETELIRSNSQALKKMIGVGAVVALPFVGNFFLIVCIKYPRELLTTHFWSDEDYVRYIKMESIERRDGANLLLQAIPKATNIVGLKLQQIVDLAQSCNTLTTNKYLHGLGHSHSIFTNKKMLNFVFTHFPPFILHHLLNSRIRDIVSDDALLYEEVIKGKSELDHKELLLISVRRSLPILDDTIVMMQNLKIYLEMVHNLQQRGTHAQHTSALLPMIALLPIINDKKLE